MATKSISQLDTQATANETDLFEVAIVDANSASGYASKKESAAAIADAIVGEYQYPLRITGTTAKTIAGAINELKNLVDLLPQFAIEVVNTLPVSDISETTIYLVPAQDPEQGNYYEEYIYVNNAWELVGTTAVDLSGYYTSAQVDTLLAAKANTSSLATVATSGAYSDLVGKPTIDTALDTTSTNAVENRAVASEINSIKSDIAVEGSASGDIATFVDGSDNPLKELKISIEAVQSGSGDPSPTNVRPITGFSAVDIGDISDTEKVQYFKGLLDGTYGFVDLSTLSWSSQYSSYRTGLFNANVSGIETNAEMLCNKYVTGAGSNSSSSFGYWNDKTIHKWTSASAAERIYIVDEDYTTATEFEQSLTGVYLIYELATPTTPTITPTEFNTLVSAFGLQGWLVQIAMPAEAGTVYGGTLDVLTGKLTVTHKAVDMGDLTWSKYPTGDYPYFYTTLDNFDYTKTEVVLNCSTYKAIAGMTGASFRGSDYDLQICNITNQSATHNVGVQDSNYTDVSTFITAVTGQKLVYKLATPIEYDLTPTEIRSLLGLNNVFADCGAVTELKYTRDLNLCINDIISRIEALEGGSNTRSSSVSPTLTKSIVSDSDTAEGILESKTEETEEETKEEAQDER